MLQKLSSLEAKRPKFSPKLDDPLKDHLADFICPGFGVEFIAFNISGEDSMLLISLLQGAGATHIISYIR